MVSKQLTPNFFFLWKIIKNISCEKPCTIQKLIAQITVKFLEIDIKLCKCVCITLLAHHNCTLITMEDIFNIASNLPVALFTLLPGLENAKQSTECHQSRHCMLLLTHFLYLVFVINNNIKMTLQVLMSRTAFLATNFIGFKISLEPIFI